MADNTEIESYKTEKEVLITWMKVIQREDPDIIIGYNIFGFDYLFMYERAVECNCIKQFLQLSRNKKEVCLSKSGIGKKSRSRRIRKEYIIYC